MTLQELELLSRAACLGIGLIVFVSAFLALFGILRDGKIVLYLVLLGLSVLLVDSARAAPPDTMRFFAEYDHRSNLFEGFPFRNQSGPEPTEDMPSLGVEFAWPKWHVTVSHGLYSRECNITRGCKFQQGTRFTARRYIGQTITLRGR